MSSACNASECDGPDASRLPAGDWHAAFEAVFMVTVIPTDPGGSIVKYMLCLVRCRFGQQLHYLPQRWPTASARAIPACDID